MYSIHLSSIFHEVVTQIDFPFKSNDYDMSIVGSCNGMLCIANMKQTICIWNPCTRMFKDIPTSPLNLLPQRRPIGGMKQGFGYDFQNEEYKLVRFWYNYGNGSIAGVYKEGSDTWKANQVIPCVLDDGNAFGVLVNGYLHWIAKHCFTSETRRLALSLLPLTENVNNMFHVTVGVLNGDLCITDYCVPLLSVDIWVMKDYGVNGSWNKLLMIPIQTAMPSIARLKLLHSFKNGELVLKMGKDTLLLYHPKYSDSRIVKISGIPAGLYDMVTFVGSLFPVNSGYFLEPERSEEVSIEEVDTEQSKKPENKSRNFLR
ncbi:hypothetical protein MKW92_051297, partial [Papaver armeniacum]